MRIAFLDTETTGLEREDEVIELAIQIWDSDTTGTVEGATFYGLWFPSGDCNPQAQKVNNYSRSAWETRGAKAFEADAVRRLRAFLTQHKPDAWGGCNTSFDLNMLENMTRRVREPSLSAICHRKVDVQPLAAPLQIAGVLKSASLASLCAHFGVTNQSAHSAIGDVQATIAVFERLVGLYWPALGVAA
jgi:DNA polymerase III epsilon subunit-like protein